MRVLLKYAQIRTNVVLLKEKTMLDYKCRVLKLASVRSLLFLVGSVAHITLSAQTASSPRAAIDLTAPNLRTHAQLPQNNHVGMPLGQVLLEGHATAVSKGIPWKGMNLVVLDGPGSVSGITYEILIGHYKKLSCQADAIVVGHAGASAHHLSSYGTSVYGDHVFSVDTLVKDNLKQSIRSISDLIITRPGGSVMLADGQVNFENQAFPGLQTGSTYLQFLRHVPESSAYEALDSFSTLVAVQNDWMIARKALAGQKIPGFARRVLEDTISGWLTSCK